MRPLSELDAEGVDGVVFDVDDTLTREGVVEREAYDAVWELRARGFRSIAVTGRPLGWSDVIAATWPVDLAVGENGAGWALRRGARIELGYFDGEDERARQRALLETIEREVARRLPDVRRSGDSSARRCDLAFDVGEAHTLDALTIASIVEIIESLGARATVSSVHAHAVPGGWDKALGVVRAADVALGIDATTLRDRFVFVGDSGNDAAAFAFFARSVGVANVAAHLDRLPTLPAFVAPDDRGRGFAAVVRHLARRKD
jgi:HAD superfamily hydrolase (TIGR01484 family)